jgi:hypothetical protein
MLESMEPGSVHEPVPRRVSNYLSARPVTRRDLSAAIATYLRQKEVPQAHPDADCLVRFEGHPIQVPSIRSRQEHNTIIGISVEVSEQGRDMSGPFGSGHLTRSSSAPLSGSVHALS